MSDDRKFERWESKNYRYDKSCITFHEYVLKVVKDQPARKEELQALLKIYPMDQLEQVLEGKKVITIEDLDSTFAIRETIAK